MKILILLISFSVFALDTFVGRISLLRGNAFRTNDDSGNRTPISMGDKVYTKDLLETNKKSILKIKLVDDSTITIGPESEFYVRNFDFKSKVDRAAVFQMMKGKLRTAIPIKAKKDSIKFKSKSVAMAVRGTKFVMDVDKKENTEITQFALLEGKISLAEVSTSKTQEISPGDKYIHASNKSSAKTINEKLSAQEMDHLNKVINDKTDIKNFNKFFLKPYQINLAQLEKNQSPKKRTKKSKKSGNDEQWKKTLNKLNKTLKENKTSP